MSRLLELLPGVFGHASGALWIEERRTLLIADAHLGYGWAQRRRGELGPVGDGRAQDRLLEVAAELEPSKVVFLGDVVHAPRPAPEERALIEKTLAAMQQRTEVIVVQGNHDRGFARDFGRLGIPLVGRWQSVAADGSPLLAIHGDGRLPETPEGGWLIAGHVHPSLSLKDAAGARHRLRVFAMGDRVLLLPAFSPFAAGWDLQRGLPEAVRDRMGSRLVPFAVTGNKVAKLKPLGSI